MPLKREAEQRACPFGVGGTLSPVPNSITEIPVGTDPRQYLNRSKYNNAPCLTTSCMAWHTTKLFTDRQAICTPAEVSQLAPSELESRAETFRKDGLEPVTNSLAIHGVARVWGRPGEETGVCLRLVREQ